MNWYYSIRGTHAHVRVFMNGAKCGDLCFRTEELTALMGSHSLNETVNFIQESSHEP